MKKIGPYITLLEGQEFQFPFCNCLLIEDELNCLIDSSPPNRELGLIKNKPIDIIVNSHGHLDHCRLNPDYPQARVFMHPTDHNMAGSGEAYLDNFGFNLFSQFKNEQMHRFYLEGINYRARVPDAVIMEGQKFQLGHTEFEVLHLPGHCAGHCGFAFPQYGFIFTADINLSNFPWYGNINSSITDFINSIERIMFLKPDMIITGHQPSMVDTGISRRLSKYRDIILRRETSIVQLLFRGKHTITEIAGERPIYGKFPEPKIIFYLHECVMVLKHLEHLMQLGKVVQDEDRYYLKEGVRPTGLNLW